MPEPATTAKCPGCGVPLSHGAAEGLCARCLLTGALAPSASEAEEASELESPATLLARREFAGYELIGEIARGGMGVVFRARQKRPARVVALKIIAAGELATPRMIERFRTEAQAAAKLDHPNIVPIYEVGHQGGWHFFSMRLIEGGTLAQLCGAPLPPRDAVRLMVKIARAIEHAHQRGVLHRDLKPGNVLIDAHGEPHLTDFGLAKVLEGSVEMTFSNAVLGTPAYMAPEQAAGGTRDVTLAVDVYGLGAVLYEMLAGRPPFTAPNTHALLRKIAEEEPAPPSRCEAKGRREEATSTLLSDLDAICLKCLEKEASLRYRTAADFADDLERALRGESILAQPSTTTQRVRKWVRRHPARSGLIATAALALLVITVGSMLFSVRLSRARQLAEQNAATSRAALVGQHLRENARRNAAHDGLYGLLPLIEAARMSGDDASLRRAVDERVAATLQSTPRLLRVWDAGGAPIHLSFSQSNRWLIAGLRGGEARVWDLETGDPIPEPPSDGRPVNNKSVVSPDGGRILQFHGTAPHLRLWKIAEGEMMSVPLNSAGGGVAIFGPDGSWFATAGERVRLWNSADGREIASLTNDSRCTWLAAGPDNTIITGLSRERAWVWDIRTGERLSPESSRVWGPVVTKFSPDRRSWLVAATGEVQVLNWPARERIAGVPVTSLIYEIKWSPDGKQFATAGFSEQARVWNATNGQLVRLPIAHESGANQAVFSPDGALLATAGFDYQLRVLRTADHRPVMPAMHRAALIEAVAFSSDGRFLAAGDAEGLVQIWELSIGAQPLLVRNQAMRVMAQSANAQKILLDDYQGTIRVCELGSGEEVSDPMHADSALMQVSLDERAQFVAAALGLNGVRIWDFKTRRLVHELRSDHAALEDVQKVVFKPDGSEFVTASRRGVLQRWRTSDAQPVGPIMKQGESPTVLNWSPNGRWIAAGRKRNVEIWDAQTGVLIQQPITGEEREVVEFVTFNPSGTQMAVGFGNDSIEPADARIYELPSLRPLGGPLRHGDGISSGVFSPDGVLFATGGEDNVARLWNSATGQPVSSALRHPGIVRGVLFRPDGKVLASGCVDGTVRLWDIARGELMAPPLQFGGIVRPLTFSDDGHRLWVSVGTSASNLGWRIDLPASPPAGVPLDAMLESLSGQRAGEAPVPTKDLVASFMRWHGGKVPAWPEDMPRWHEERAIIAEQSSAWFTAAFHLERLATAHPENAALQARLQRARDLAH
jgi:eukaryotic-like serine/threonine-protein kinase